jgi:hypothetical protein
MSFKACFICMSLLLAASALPVSAQIQTIPAMPTQQAVPPAQAATPAQHPASPVPDVTPQARVKALQTRINQDAAQGLLKIEAINALEGKQAELENRVERLSSEKQPTADEQVALNLTIKEQEDRLKHYEQALRPARATVDPSAVPPPTYVAPNGTTIIAPGGSYGNSGVVMPQNGPVTNPAPQNLQQAPAQ